VQLSVGRGATAHLRALCAKGSAYDAPNLKKRCWRTPKTAEDLPLRRGSTSRCAPALPGRARGAPVYCTKIASRLVRTYTDRHGLKELVKELLGQEISKQQQSSDWGGPVLSDAQRDYAASDVRYLHAMKEELDKRLVREGRMELAQACFDFLPARAQLDLAGWPEIDIFAHV
jgi:ribonuclease D